MSAVWTGVRSTLELCTFELVIAPPVHPQILLAWRRLQLRVESAALLGQQGQQPGLVLMLVAELPREGNWPEFSNHCLALPMHLHRRQTWFCRRQPLMHQPNAGAHSEALLQTTTFIRELEQGADRMRPVWQTG